MRGQVEVEPVERIGPPSRRDFLERYVRRRRPVIIERATRDWPALETWSFEHLRERYGDRRVPIARTDGRRLVRDPSTGIPYRDAPFGPYLDALRRGEAPSEYAMFIIDEWLPELLGDLRAPSFAPSAPWSIRKLWVSAADTRTPLHHDLPDNLYAQIVGSKRVLLFHPRDELGMYRYRPWSRLPQVSRVDAFAPNLTRFPRFGRARPLECVVGPGDLLYIPRLFWHQLRSLEASVSVNTWWASGPLYALVRLALAYQRVRKLRY